VGGGDDLVGVDGAEVAVGEEAMVAKGGDAERGVGGAGAGVNLKELEEARGAWKLEMGM
jgi:hypothetical protein